MLTAKKLYKEGYKIVHGTFKKSVANKKALAYNKAGYFAWVIPSKEFKGEYCVWYKKQPKEK
jgi:hypothetical protein